LLEERRRRRLGLPREGRLPGREAREEEKEGRRRKRRIAEEELKVLRVAKERRE